MGDKNKTIIIEPKVPENDFEKVIQKLNETGINALFLPKYSDKKELNDFEIYSFEKDADVVVIESEKWEGADKTSNRLSYWTTLHSNSDIDNIAEIAKDNVESVIVEFEKNAEWKIIPLENLIAELHNVNTKIYTVINDPSEIKMMFTILELGVDGVVLRINNLEDMDKINSELEELGKTNLQIEEDLEQVIIINHYMQKLQK